jgi:hypothetical protein
MPATIIDQFLKAAHCNVLSMVSEWPRGRGTSAAEDSRHQKKQKDADTWSANHG